MMEKNAFCSKNNVTRMMIVSEVTLNAIRMIRRPQTMSRIFITLLVMPKVRPFRMMKMPSARRTLVGRIGERRTAMTAARSMKPSSLTNIADHHDDGHEGGYGEGDAAEGGSPAAFIEPADDLDDDLHDDEADGSQRDDLEP